MLKRKKLLEEIVRVDHAGEYGAARIYLGQIRALRGRVAQAQVREMYEHEQVHLEYFDKELKMRQIRSTALLPLWHVLGYGLGYITGLLGEKAAMACTVAVEEVIGEHYQEQEELLESIDTEKSLRQTITIFKEEELEHRDIGLRFKAQDALFYPILKGLIAGCTKLAIALSKKI